MICAGIDTHKDAHVLVIADEVGRELSYASFATDVKGICALVDALGKPDECIVVGIEGAGSYGAGVADALMSRGFAIVEVSRPKRADRSRSRDKNDHADALRAAKRALAGEGVPVKARGDASAIACLLTTYERIRSGRVAMSNAAHGILVAAPCAVRARFAGMTTDQIMASAARKRRTGKRAEDAALESLRALSLIWREMRTQEKALLARMEELILAHAPAMLEVSGCAVVTSACMIALAGDAPSRIRSESALARMCGTAPLDASTGPRTRHRLDRGGCRRANAALHTIVMCRMAHDERTRAYVERRTKEGLSKKEIMRCLKRYVCREIYRILCAEEERRKAESATS